MPLSTALNRKGIHEGDILEHGFCFVLFVVQMQWEGSEYRKWGGARDWNKEREICKLSELKSKSKRGKVSWAYGISVELTITAQGREQGESSVMRMRREMEGWTSGRESGIWGTEEFDVISFPLGFDHSTSPGLFAFLNLLLVVLRIILLEVLETQ